LIPAYIVQFFQKARPEWSKLTAYRASAITMSLFYLVGIAVMIFAPETRGKPLPQDEDGGSPPAGES
jgi:hypothetical protein